jgi:hypothetical protein
MKTGLYTNDFSRIFSKLLEKSSISCYQIHQYSGIDQAYLSRLRSGEKCNPSPEVIMRIVLALACNKVTMYDIETLLNSVGRSLRIKA